MSSLGKWFNYGIIFIVLILDMNMWKNQIFYEPFPYGQYTDTHDKIYTVVDAISLETHNVTQMSFEWRSQNINPLTNQSFIEGDFKMNSIFTNSTLSTRGLAFIPSLAAFLMFFLLVWFFGRTPSTEDDHYGGRLHKRKRQRSSWRERIRSSLAHNSINRQNNHLDQINKEIVSQDLNLSISQSSFTPLKTPARMPFKATTLTPGKAPLATFD